MNEKFLDEASDVAFARLEAVGGDPRRLAEPFRTVAMIYAAQGAIDNGGLHCFFENDWPGNPPYSMFSDGYRNIGAVAEADAIDTATGWFPFSNPERHAGRRCELLSGSLGERIKTLDGGLGSDAWGLLAEYASIHKEAFGGGSPARD